MGGSSEKSKDIAWNSKMKPMILKKREFYTRKSKNNEIC